MKRVGNLFEKIVDHDNIDEAIEKASLGKRNHRAVSIVRENREFYIEEIQWLLNNQEYIPTEPIEKVLKDTRQKKDRIIYKPNFFPDQIIQWALMLQLQPVISRGMYEYSIGSVPKRGLHMGVKKIRKWMDNDVKGTKYCVKMDVRHLYPSIDNEILKSKFRKIVKDSQCLWLIDTIINSSVGQPIGFYTAQWFSNYYLQDLDHFIKEKLDAKYYIRYVDDMVILGPNKRKLHAMRVEIEQFLLKEKLIMKPNWQVFYISHKMPMDAHFEKGHIPKMYRGRFIDFLGMKFYRDTTTLRGRDFLRIGRRYRKIAKKGYLYEHDAFAVISYWSWMKHSNSYTMWHKYMKNFVKLRTAKRSVSVNAKIRNVGGRPVAYKFDSAYWLQTSKIPKH